MDITTENLHKYDVGFTRTNFNLEISITYEGIKEFATSSTSSYRSDTDFNFSNTIRRFESIKKLIQNDYNKRLFLTYLPIVGLYGFNNVQRLEFRKYLKDFDIYTMLNNSLVNVENMINNTTNLPMTMGVGKYHNFTRAYVLGSDFNESTTWVGLDKNLLKPHEISAISLNAFMTLKRDFSYINFNEHGSMLHDGQRKEYPTYCGVPCTENLLPISSYILRAFNLVACGDCGNFTMDKYLDDDCTCTHCNKTNLKYKINDYSYKPHPRFFRLANGNPMGFLSPHFNKNKYFGYEIETNIKREYRHEIAKVVDRVIRATELNGKALFYAKYDSSLGQRGVEFVSHPMTYKCFMKIDWDEMFAKFRSMLSSYSDNRCGIHIHMSRNFMSDYTMSKFMRLMYENVEFTELIAQRNSNDWAEIDKGDIKRFMKSTIVNKHVYSDNYEKFIKANFGNRYKALNFQNSATIECRIFKGNLKSDRLKKNIEYLMAMKEFCEVNSYSNINIKNFVGFVKSNFKSYMNLNRFLNQFNKSLNQIINGGK
tara:strand:+ start:633 stop:2249 length:1617 start_codon:yes stop_codon:yes gene_type:complete